MNLENIASALVIYVLLGVAVTAATENRLRYRQWIAKSYEQEEKPAPSGAYAILFYAVTYPVTVGIAALGAAALTRMKSAGKPTASECRECRQPMPHSTTAEALMAAKDLGDGLRWDYLSYCRPTCDPVWRNRSAKRASRLIG